MSRTGRARARARTGAAPRERTIPTASSSTLIPRRQPTRARVIVTAILLVVALGGAVLQTIEFRQHVPGEHRLWLAAYLFVAAYAALTLSARIRAARNAGAASR